MKYIVKNFKIKLKTFETREAAEQYINTTFKGDKELYQITESGVSEAGYPLEVLVRTPEQIEELEKQGIIRPKPKKKTFYQLVSGKNKLNMKFKTYQEAVDFARLNTSNHPEIHWSQVYKIIKVDELLPKPTGNGGEA